MSTAQTAHFRLINGMKCYAAKSFGSQFDPDEKLNIGHVEKLVFKADGNEFTLDKDIPAKDPENPGQDPEDVIAVLDFVDWGGKATDPFTFWGRISPKNAEKMSGALSGGGGKNMEIEWKIFKYSDPAKTHFVTFSHGDAAIEMTIDPNSMDNGPESEAAEDITDPRNVRFKLHMKAIGKQVLHYASGVGANEQKQAGNAFAAG